MAFPKKLGVNGSELHRTTSLMSHITKLMKQILMNRGRSRIRPEIGHEQRGFVKMIRMISEKALQMQKELHLFL